MLISNRRLIRPLILIASIICWSAGLIARADVGDPQIRTNHPWYPGELACSSFSRLFNTQTALYERVVGLKPTTDEQKVLAAWLWRNTHYYHGEEGAEDLWGKGFTKGGDARTREYWTGLFAHGFGLCGTTHSQWTAEMQALLGHTRGRGVGVDGHNSFEVFLKGGAYGEGRWALLDHDISTVIFSKEGNRLLSLREVRDDWKRLTDRTFAPEKQRGWLVCGLHKNDGGVYRKYEVAEYLAGYEGPPPMVHLRRGETLRRYFQPGLEDGKTFVFWGRNYRTGVIPGPERSITWVNQPDKMYQSRSGAGFRPGQARYGNAVYVYRPDFASKDYREAIVEESDSHVVFEFVTPFIIAATPANDQPWGIYDAGCRNGLVLNGKADCDVAISTDHGQNWHACGKLNGALDLTDRAKGRRQYLLRFACGPPALAKAALRITTVCQANVSVLPHLRDGGCTISYEASHQAVLSAGPNIDQSQAHIVEGRFGSPSVTLELKSPRAEAVTRVHAAAHVLSGSPPRHDVKYQIEVSVDGGRTWTAAVKDWTIERHGDEPKDFWSQSLCFGALRLADPRGPVRIRFRNNGGKNYSRCEAHLVYRTERKDSTRVTFEWKDDGGVRNASHVFPSNGNDWLVPTGKNVQTLWVDFEPVWSK